MNNRKGITLISLIITIIIILILASIVISFSVGENGIFNLAKKAVENYSLSTEYEQEKINELGNYILNIENNKKEDVYTQLKVGDFVNYPVYYDNVSPTNPATNTTFPPKDEYFGWRILSVDLDTRTIKLISAGIPLSYYHKDVNTTSIPNLTTNFFNTPISSSYYSFDKCGFKTSKNGTIITNINDVKQLFLNDFTQIYGEGENYIDNGNTYTYTKGNPKVQSLSKADVDSLLGTTPEHGTIIDNNLLLILNKDTSCEPVNYWCVQGNPNGWGIYAIAGTGTNSIYMISEAAMGSPGVRPVVTLKPNIKFTQAQEQINDTTTWNISI